ncbi:uncharacterized protein K02A2.6-like [Ornithodoros turicata]|uniref:uncharacterized protein K02A2.6-like n=1 Tax=Ornithodoros turicata TaxID=34597 RepID=UPI003138C5CD
METLLPPFPPFDPHSDATSLAQRWIKWQARFDNFLLAANVTDASRKRAMLLHYAGEEVYDIFNTLSNTGSDYDTAVACLKQHFAPKKNVVYERHVFRLARQNPGETLDQFHVRLRKLSTTCEFTDVDKELLSQIIEGTTSQRLRRTALRETDVTLDKVLATGRSLENAEVQATSIENPAQSHSVQKIETKKGTHSTRPKNKARDKRRTERCTGCGGSWPHPNGKTTCPAWGATCLKCHKRNHFARWCRSTAEGTATIQSLTTSSKPQSSLRQASSEESVFHVQSVINNLPVITVIVNKTPVDFFLDTGSGVNVVGEQTWSEHFQETLEETRTRLVPYGLKQEIPVMGTFTATFKTQGKSVRAPIFVVKGPQASLLSYQTASELNLINIVQSVGQETSVDARREFPRLLEGLGKLKNFQVKLAISSNVKPVAQRHRRIPFRMRKALEAELTRLEDMDIIERVTGPTPWVSPVVVVPKPHTEGAIRMCIDMREANRAIARERHVMPTVEDIINTLNGAAYFSKLDLNEGYHQLELEESSRRITTFSTHCGLRRYKRLLFGVNAAAEIFQDAISQVLPDEDGIINISDDILVSGRSIEEHDRRLRLVLKNLEEAGLTLNLKKCVLGSRSVKFFGHVFSAQGVTIDPGKVRAVAEMTSPRNAAEVKSLLGMVNYCSRFIPRLAEIVEPLRRLTHTDVEFSWNQEQEDALERLRKEMSHAPTLAYFDDRKNTYVITDAGPEGVAGILVQETRDKKDHSILAYHSRPLTPTEKRYPQIDKEMLAIVSMVERFRVYLAGGRFTVKTDHLPLVSILKNASAKLSARLERLSLRLQHYVFDVEHIPGKTNPADYLSRHPPSTKEGSPMKEAVAAEEYVSFLVRCATPKAMTLQDVQKAYKDDEQMDLLIAALRRPDKKFCRHLWKHGKLKPFNQIKEELTVTESNLVLRGPRLVIPEKAQMEVVQLAHRGHQGMVKTKQLIREKVWFPGIDKMVEAVVRNCEACQRTVEEKKNLPLVMTELPDGPWLSLAADFAGPLPGNKYLLVVVDEYSRFPVVATLSSLNGGTVTTKLNDMFTVHGIPEVVKTDNGPPFFGKEFADFMKHNGIRHHRVTPLWPQANGEVERFIKNLKKTIKAACVGGHNWKDEIDEYLLNYRATPHSTTGVTPAELLFGRKIRTKLPQMQQKLSFEDIQERDSRKKRQMKAYSDHRRHAAHHGLHKGDSVLLKRTAPLSHETPYEPQPYKVIRIQGTAVTAVRDHRKIVRNASFFKRIPCRDQDAADDWDSTMIDDTSKDQTLESSQSGAMTGNLESASTGQGFKDPTAVEARAPLEEPRRYPIRLNRGQPPQKFGDTLLH